MHVLKRKTLWVWALMFPLLALTSVWAQAPEGTEVVMVIDASGSMRRTDPSGTRQRAGQLFATLLGRDNRVAVIEFADEPRILTPLTGLESEASRNHVLGSIQQVTSDGQFTDITAALDSALNCFDLTTARPRCIILLTDGEIDLEAGEAAENLSRAHLRTEVLGQCAQHHIPVHTIAFSDEAEHDVLREISEATQAQSRVVTDPSMLHSVFADLFETIDQPQMAPIEGDTVAIDSSVSDVTFLISESDGAAVTITAPSGGEVTESTSAGQRNVRWLTTPEFVLVTVEDPEVGNWTIHPVSGHDRVVLVTDLKLETSPIARQQSVGSPMSAQSWLSEGGTKLTNDQILSTVGFELLVTDERGQSASALMEDDGQSDDFEAGDSVYGAFGDYLNLAGNHRVTVRARGATFSRQQSFMISAIDDWLTPVVEPNTVAPGEGAVIQAALRPGTPPQRDLTIRGVIVAPDGTETTLTLPPVDGENAAALFRATQTAGTYNLRVEAEGHWSDGEVIDYTSVATPFRVDPAAMAVAQLPPMPEIEDTPPEPEPVVATGTVPLEPVNVVPEIESVVPNIEEAGIEPEAAPEPARDHFLLIAVGVSSALVLVIIGLLITKRKSDRAPAAPDETTEEMAEAGEPKPKVESEEKKVATEKVEEVSAETAEAEEVKEEVPEEEPEEEEPEEDKRTPKTEEIYSQEDIDALFNQAATGVALSADEEVVEEEEEEEEKEADEDDEEGEPLSEEEVKDLFAADAPTETAAEEAEEEPEEEKVDLSPEELDALFATSETGDSDKSPDKPKEGGN